MPNDAVFLNAVCFFRRKNLHEFENQGVYIRGVTIHWCIDASWYSSWQYTNRYTCLWTVIRDTAFFLFFFKTSDCQKLVQRTKKESSKMADMKQARVNFIINSLNWPAGTSMIVIVIFIFVMKQTKLSDIVLFWLNPLKLKPYFWLTCNYHDTYRIALWISWYVSIQLERRLSHP